MSRDQALLLDVLIAARKIRRYMLGISRGEFEANDMLQDAIMRQVQIIGEAAGHISPVMREEHPELPWNEMIGMRHRLVHDYNKIDMGRVWEAARESVPELIAALEPLVPPPEED
jgi:uncharacterized protein with HEPN domain